MYDVVYAYHRLDVDDLISLAALKGGESVLDLGCGTGWGAMAAKDIVRAEGRVVGVDCSQKMLEVAEEGAKKKGLGGQIEWLQGDITELFALPTLVVSTEWKGFDVITCLWTHGSLPLIQQYSAVRDWAKLLAPGGRIVMDFEDPHEIIGAFTGYTVEGEIRAAERWADEPAHVMCESLFEKLAQASGLQLRQTMRLNRHYQDLSQSKAHEAAARWEEKKRQGQVSGAMPKEEVERFKQEECARKKAAFMALGLQGNHKLLSVAGVLQQG